ncbi:hypothetical protein WR25_14298 [Diploscapter pachys]|uniref:G-protein coupled receptors family 1 profile domain-containing protein n=1 Tax=Diploscapter pachys TaxID=2018661 RepID=A0A2A2KH12_9BILA|nr:hypothetical protein WR25_14298 [Diploscapter pachys]
MNFDVTIDPATWNCIYCYPISYILVFGALIVVTILVGLLGNIFVVYTIVADKKLMSSSVNQMLLNLAIADLGNLVFCIPDVVMVLLDRGWLLPSAACHLIRFLQEYFLYASVLLQLRRQPCGLHNVLSAFSLQVYTTLQSVLSLLATYQVHLRFERFYRIEIIEVSLRFVPKVGEEKESENF